MSDDRDLLDRLLLEAGVDLAPAAEPPLVADASAGPFELSYAQELLWRLDLATPGLTAYNVPVARRLVGPLDVASLQSALVAIAARHDVFHTRFAAAGDEPCAVLGELAAFALNVIDLDAVPRDDRAREARRVLDERVRVPFRLATERAFRATLVRIDETEHVLLLEFHHIACDGTSVALVMDELAARYRAELAGRSPDLPELGIAYHDFARWQRAMLDGGYLEDALAYWRSELALPSEPLAMLGDGTPESDADAAHRHVVELDAQTTAALGAFARARGATPYMALLAAFATLLHRQTGSTSFRIGSNVAARMRPALESIVGYFNNTLALRCDFAGEPSFDEILERVRARCFGAFDHQEIPYERLALAARANAGVADTNPLFNVVFSVDNASDPIELPGLRVAPFDIDLGRTKFDLSLFMREGPRGIELTLLTRARLHSVEAGERFLERLRDLVRTVLAGPTVAIARLPLLMQEERDLFARSNATAVAFANGDIVERFERSVAEHPDALALVCGETTMTYGELDARAAAFAALVAERGLAHGSRIAVESTRSPDAIAALLGILKAGCVLVPFEPTLPPARIEQQFAAADVRLAFVAETTLDPADAERASGAVERLAFDVPGDASGVRRRPPIAGGDLAYVVFTSGSTGIPKGVAVTHDNIANYTAAISRVLGDLGPGTHVGLTGTLAADLGYTALFPALCSGATLHLIPSDVTTDGARFADYVRAHPLDLLKITPRHLRALAEGASLAAILPARWTIVGGELLSLAFASELVAAGRGRTLNHYGPTETTVGATTFELDAASLSAARAAGARSVPIGLPLANVRAYVLDARDELVPLGALGELAIGGAGVASGYLGRPEATAERFVSHPTLGRIYRTGDRVRRLASGALEYLGRADEQVKIRGYRVELGEIETALRDCAEIADAAVRIDAEADRVVAYLVRGREATGEPSDALAARIARRLERTLPGYMVPQQIVFLDVLLRTPNGKLDRSALAEADAPLAVAALQPARTETERALVEIWAAAFKRDAATVGVTEDFLAVGGHSLIAIRMLGAINRRFGVRLPLASVLEARTIAALARLVDLACAEPNASEAPLARIARVARTSDQRQGTS